MASSNRPTQLGALGGLLTPVVPGKYTLLYKRKLEFMMKVIRKSAFCSQEVEYYCLVSKIQLKMSGVQVMLCLVKQGSHSIVRR